MSQALTIDIADALVAELNAEAAKPNGGALGQSIVAQRYYRPEFDLAQLKELRISVVPKSIAITGMGRASNQHDVAVDVAVQKKVNPADYLVAQFAFALAHPEYGPALRQLADEPDPLLPVMW